VRAVGKGEKVRERERAGGGGERESGPFFLSLELRSRSARCRGWKFGRRFSEMFEEEERKCFLKFH